MALAWLCERTDQWKFIASDCYGAADTRGLCHCSGEVCVACWWANRLPLSLRFMFAPSTLSPAMPSLPISSHSTFLPTLLPLPLSSSLFQFPFRPMPLFPPPPAFCLFSLLSRVFFLTFHLLPFLSFLFLFYLLSSYPFPFHFFPQGLQEVRHASSIAATHWWLVVLV